MTKNPESPTVRLYRELLGVGPMAGADEIKKAYHRMALLYHPDRNPDKNTAADFQKVHEAFLALSDQTRVRLLNQSHLRERLFNNVISGINISFGSFFGHRLFSPSRTHTERRFRLGVEKDAERDTDTIDLWQGVIERDCSILDNAAYDAIETVYAGKFSVGDDERLVSGVSNSELRQLPWVILNNQGILYFLDGKLNQALKCYDELNRRIPNNIMFMYRLGLCHVLQGFKTTRRDFLGRLRPDRTEIERGILLFRRCIAIGESRKIGRLRCLLIRKVLADVHQNLGQRRKAWKVWNLIQKMDANSVEAAFRVRGTAAAQSLLKRRSEMLAHRKDASKPLPATLMIAKKRQG